METDDLLVLQLQGGNITGSRYWHLLVMRFYSAGLPVGLPPHPPLVIVGTLDTPTYRMDNSIHANCGHCQRCLPGCDDDPGVGHIELPGDIHTSAMAWNDDVLGRYARYRAHQHIRHSNLPPS